MLRMDIGFFTGILRKLYEATSMPFGFTGIVGTGSHNIPKSKWGFQKLGVPFWESI